MNQRENRLKFTLCLLILLGLALQIMLLPAAGLVKGYGDGALGVADQL